MSWGRVATHWQIVGRGSFARRVCPPVLSSCQWRHASDMRCFMHEPLSTGRPHAGGHAHAMAWCSARGAAPAGVLHRHVFCLFPCDWEVCELKRRMHSALHWFT